MSDDTLNLLASFRADSPDADDATIERIYRRATSPVHQQPHARVNWSRLSGRPRLALALVLAALAVVPAAIAVGGKIVDLFEGTPAPPPISAAFDMHNKMADLATQNGFAAKFPTVDVSQAHGVVETQTPDGPEDLWAAPNNQGGQCWFIDFANDTPGPHGQSGAGSCDTPTPPASQIQWGDVWVQPHPTVMTVYGHVLVDAARLEVTLSDGSTQTLPVVEGFFLGTIPNGVKPTQIVAYDSAGSQVAHDNLP